MHESAKTEEKMNSKSRELNERSRLTNAEKRKRITETHTAKILNTTNILIQNTPHAGE